MTLTQRAPAEDESRTRHLRAVDEAMLLGQAQDGDVDAFEQLVDAHLAEVFRVALMMLKNREHAENVTEEIFIGAWRNMPYLNTPAQLRAWLVRSCIRRCLDLRGHGGASTTR